MSNPFLGEIRLLGFNFNPKFWAKCDGQLLPINDNTALYALIGSQYGGDDRTTFALPDLRGRVPAHIGLGIVQGYMLGEETNTLNNVTMGAHNHTMAAIAETVDKKTPENNLLGKYDSDATDNTSFASASSIVPMKEGAVSSNGGGRPHINMQPYQVVNYCIALQGLLPSRS
jgi:microcystin-dependent protein